MQFKPYRKPDGTEELRLKPESAEDCDSIDDCSKCFFEETTESACEDLINIGKPLELSSSELDMVLRKLGVELFDPRKTTEFTRHPQGSSLFDDYSSIPMKLLGNQKVGVDSHIHIGAFTIKNGKVVTDPETREIMEELGIIEEIERIIHEKDEN